MQIKTYGTQNQGQRELLLLGVVRDCFDKFDLVDRCEGDNFHLFLSKAEVYNGCLGFYPMSKAVRVKFSGDIPQDFGFASSSLVLEEMFLFQSICGKRDQHEGILEEIV